MSLNPDAQMEPITTAQTSVTLRYNTPGYSAKVYVRNQWWSDSTHTLHSFRGRFWYWADSKCRACSHADLTASLWPWLEKQYVTTFNPQSKEPIVTMYVPTDFRVKGIIKALEAYTHIPDDSDPPFWISPQQGDPPAAEIVSCQNGLLHVPTRTLHPHTPRFFCTTGLTAPYQANATCPVWLEFLKSVWEKDSDSIETLQEWFGYVLTPDTSMQKILLVVGPPRSGKGTISRVLTESLDGNIAAPTLSALATNFGLQPLLTRPLAIISDARLNSRSDSTLAVERLLNISGEDRITIDEKYKTPTTVKLPTRIMILTNEVPRLSDASGALAARFIVLQMKLSFLGREDLTLPARLRSELPGILNWALDGRDRLYARGSFRQPKSAAESVQCIADLGSPIRKFVEDNCEFSSDAIVSVHALYVAYQDFCSTEGISPPDKPQFGRDLRAAFPVLERVQRTVSKKRVPHYEGLRLHGMHASNDISDSPKNETKE